MQILLEIIPFQALWSAGDFWGIASFNTTKWITTQPWSKNLHCNILLCVRDFWDYIKLKTHRQEKLLDVPVFISDLPQELIMAKYGDCKDAETSDLTL